jgi:hypothetical protein
MTAAPFGGLAVEFRGRAAALGALPQLLSDNPFIFGTHVGV